MTRCHSGSLCQQCNAVVSPNRKVPRCIHSFLDLSNLTGITYLPRRPFQKNVHGMHVGAVRTFWRRLFGRGGKGGGGAKSLIWAVVPSWPEPFPCRLSGRSPGWIKGAGGTERRYVFSSHLRVTEC